ncbi:hypothetical protein CACET_c05930 [Clostridium aceticum]|uniref:Uncharacterized protein n=1 Tax=Clostridium aceticum TaxID=84022 RepID=A0A0G3W6Y5_9CLOT|nr:hypothetical protein [Clostridium aceticum]AKL94103.1 hypothetical protein CACET_c05930 [Clostridium aceticum]
MICSNCQEPIPKGEEMQHWGAVLCEDCYVDAISIPKTCDVAAVYSAKSARKHAGHTGTEGLTDLQKEVYEYVKANDGKVPFGTLMKKFELSDGEMRRVFAPLRHCELLKGAMIDGVPYCVVMEGGPGSIDG